MPNQGLQQQLAAGLSPAAAQSKWNKGEADHMARSSRTSRGAVPLLRSQSRYCAEYHSTRSSAHVAESTEWDAHHTQQLPVGLPQHNSLTWHAAKLVADAT